MGRKDGELSRLERAYRQWRGMLLRFASVMVGDCVLAEDVVQDAFVRVMRSGARFDSTKAFKTYLLRSVRSAAVDILRKKPASQLPTTAATTPDFVSDLLSALPQQQREVVVLRIWGKMTFRDIAETLGVPLGTVLSRMRYAMMRLRRLVSE